MPQQPAIPTIRVHFSSGAYLDLPPDAIKGQRADEIISSWLASGERKLTPRNSFLPYRLNVAQVAYTEELKAEEEADNGVPTETAEGKPRRGRPPRVMVELEEVPKVESGE
jgi:hypothetical protein